MKSSVRLLFSVFIAALLFGCATDVERTTSLVPGMTQYQVKASMGGPPSQTQFIANRIIWKYTLHEDWKGLVPYYLVFNKDMKLESWYEDEQEYEKQQQLWLEALQTSPTTENVNVNVHQ